MRTTAVQSRVCVFKALFSIFNDFSASASRDPRDAQSEHTAGLSGWQTLQEAPLVCRQEG